MVAVAVAEGVAGRAGRRGSPATGFDREVHEVGRMWGWGFQGCKVARGLSRSQCGRQACRQEGPQGVARGEVGHLWVAGGLRGCLGVTSQGVAGGQAGASTLTVRSPQASRWSHRQESLKHIESNTLLISSKHPALCVSSFDACVQSPDHICQAEKKSRSSRVGSKWQSEVAEGWRELEKAGYKGFRHAWTEHPVRKKPCLEGLTPTARQIAIIDLCFVVACTEARVNTESLESLDVVRDLIIDVSQGVERGSWGKTLPTITTSNRSYMYGNDRLISPVELLQVYGWPCPTDHIPGLSSCSLLDVVAECMPLQALAVPLLALVLAMGTRLPGLYDSPVHAGHVRAGGGQNLNSLKHRLLWPSTFVVVTALPSSSPSLFQPPLIVLLRSVAVPPVVVAAVCVNASHHSGPVYVCSCRPVEPDSNH